MKRAKASLPSVYCLHDDHWYLEASIRSVAPAGPVFAFVSRLAWNGSPGEWERCADVARSLGAEVIVGDWPNEEMHRQAALRAMRERGHSYVLTPDGDEVVEPELLKALVEIARDGLADRVMCCFDTYWKSPEYVIRPREAIRPLMLVNLERARHVFCRAYEGGRELVLGPEYGVVHHLSYCGPDERIARKLATWGHRNEVLPGWWERVWKGWDGNKLMRDLHPTHPRAYGFAERVPISAALEQRTDRTNRTDTIRIAASGAGSNIGGTPMPLPGWPSVSVVIPLYGGEDDIRLCLESLVKCSDLLHEVIVMDDCSPDGAAAVAESFGSRFTIGAAEPFPFEAGAVVIEMSDEAGEIGPIGRIGRIADGIEQEADAEVLRLRPRRGGASAQDDGHTAEIAGEVVCLSRKLRVLRNEANLGFAGACNRGYLASTGEVVVFLNSDTVVPRAGLARLVESLMETGTVGAVGPYTNNAGYDQPIQPTYTSLGTLDLFAEDFAERAAEDREVPLLVGFCLAVRRSVIEEVACEAVLGCSGVEVLGGDRSDKTDRTDRTDFGAQNPHAVRSSPTPPGARGDLARVPFDTRFGRGLYEDNDLCYRIQRAGYKIRIAARSYVHHSGSKSLGRIGVHPHVLLEQNKGVFYAKWNEDLESGFASHLPGQRGENIVWQRQNRPDLLRKRMREYAAKADISLCMIVRDEERVLGDCLRSAKDAFVQIVVVDTGSTDRTVEIAGEHGAEVYEMPWPDSFAAARNESLKHAKGKWIFWLDADDTISHKTAVEIMQAAVNAPDHVVGYVMPVQFVEESAGATRVDHLKLFRNLPGLEFEGRIHEQILPSLRKHPGEIGRLHNVVLHSGYDTSPDGQKKKRARDEKLLRLDLKERPKHPFVLFNLGMTAHYCDDHEAAIKWLKKSLQYSGPEDSHLRKVFALMGVSYRKLGKKDLALETFRGGLERVLEDAELRFQLALTLADLGRYAEAKTEYLRIKRDHDRYFSSFDVSILEFKRYFNLGGVCLQLGEYSEARDWLRRAAASTSSRSGKWDAGEALFVAAMGREDFGTAREAFELMRKAGGLNERATRFYLDLQRLRGEDPQEALMRLVDESPLETAPRLLLARGLLERGFVREAQPHLRLLDELGCAEAAFFRGVTATRGGDLVSALHFMKRARDLNPGHGQTLQQIAALERELEVA